MTKSIRCISFLLCFVLLFFAFAGPFRQQAQAVAIVDDIIVAIILAVAAASGIAIQSNGFSTVGEFILDKLAEFGQTIGKTWSDIQDAFSARNWLVLQGALTIGSALSDLVTGFIDWLRVEFDFADDTDTPIIESIAGGLFLGPYPIYSLPTDIIVSSTLSYSFISSDAVYAYYYKAPHPSVAGHFITAVFCFSPASTSCTVIRYSGNQQTSGVNTLTLLSPSGFYVRPQYQFSYSTSDTVLDSRFIYNSEPFSDVMSQSYSISSAPSSSDFVNAGVGTMDIPLVDDPASDDGLTLTFPGSQVLSIDDIIAIIEAAVTSAYPTIEVEETPANELPEEMDYPTVGLTDVFPFCIPFDLYAFFSVLAADPVAPHFEIPFRIEGLVDYTFVIDLSGFDTVAQILRTMELLLFCVGLVLITRNQIRG